MSTFTFIKEIEKMIHPNTIGTLQFLQTFNKLVPRKVQDKLMQTSAKKDTLHGICR
ncbi:MAG: hypothetical protein ACK5MW_05065 [Enterococcus sp.]